MPAPSESVVFSVESAILFAAKDILESVGGFSPVFLDGDFDDLPDECTMVKFQDFGMLGVGNEYSGGPGWAAGATEYVIGSGQLEISSRLLKTGNSASYIAGLRRALDERSGLIRSLFSRHRQLFTVGRLPYHAVVDIIRQAPTRGVDNNNNVERQVISERFLLTYEILPTAWPTLS